VPSVPLRPVSGVLASSSVKPSLAYASTSTTTASVTPTSGLSVSALAAEGVTVQTVVKSDRERAYRLAHATDQYWRWTGLSLASLKRLCPDKFIRDTHLLICNACSKKGHLQEQCPLAASPMTQDSFIIRLFLSTPPIIPDGTELQSALKAVAGFVTQLDCKNPFATETGSAFALRKGAAVWRAIGAPIHVISWIYAGYKLKFFVPPPMVGFENHPGAFAHPTFIDEEIAKRLQRRQLEVIEESNAHVINPIDVVTKSSGGLRLIVDCRLINGFLPDIAFKLEGLSVVPQIVRPGDWMFSTDLADAYYHIPIHPTSRKFLCIRWRGKVYRYTVLPFGLSIAPWVFTKVVRPVITFCRRLGVAVVAYLDDFLWADDEKHIATLVQFATTLLALLGFDVSTSKSELTPAQILKFLGLLINSNLFEFSIPAEKLQKITTVVDHLLARVQAQKKVSARDVAVVCGHLLSVRMAVTPARIYTRALYASLNDAKSWGQTLTLSELAVGELSFWKESLKHFNGKALIRGDSAFFLHTDASDDGWGAHVDGESAFGLFEKKDCAPLTSSTCRELLGLLCALRTPNICKHIENAKVTFVLDSTAAVANLRKGGGPIAELSSLTKMIWTECLRLRVDASAVWSRRDDNEAADFLSKYRDHADWQLNMQVFEWLDQRWGPHTIDRFASSDNSKCKRFNARYYDANAEAIDAFAMSWAGEVNFANPDFNDIDKVIAHARRDRARLTLIFPYWPSKAWMNVIRREAVDIVTLPRIDNLLSPGRRSAHIIPAVPPYDICAAHFVFDQSNATSKG
jgi:hypothetical protein